MQNRGTGLLITGARDWHDYTVTADVTPHLAQEAGVPSQRTLIAETVGLVVHIEGGSRGRRVTELE